jgi:arylsulfatase A-like enzyme
MRPLIIRIRGFERAMVFMLVILFAGILYLVNVLILRQWLAPESLAFDLSLAVFFAAVILVIRKRASRKRGGNFLCRIAGILAVVSRVLIIFVMLFWLAVNLGPRFMPPSSESNIVMIVIDCLRYDHLGCYGRGGDISPNIDDLARRGIVFQRAYSPASWTKPAVASLFTGLDPLTHKVLFRSDALSRDKLCQAEVLRNQGYTTAFLNGVNALITPMFGYGQGFDHYVETEKISAGDLVDDFVELLPVLQKKAPFFAYLHFMDVHLPYTTNQFTRRYLPDGAEPYFTPGKISVHAVRELMLQPWFPRRQLEYVELFYDGQVHYVDQQIGRIIACLQQQDLLKNTLIVVSADHGEEFWDHDGFEHGHTLYEEIIHVPLIMSGGGLPTAAPEQPVRLTDLLRTVSVYAGISHTPANPESVDLLSMMDDPVDADLPVFATSTLIGNILYARIREPYKLIVNSGSTGLEKLPEPRYVPADVQLFNLAQDPAETGNLQHARQPTVDSMYEVLTDFVNPSIDADMDGATVTIDKETKEKMRALGYVR